MQCVCTILSSVTCPTLHFPTFSHNRHDFREKTKKVTEHKMRVLFCLQLCSGTFLIQGRTERDTSMIKNVYWASRKIPLFLSDFDETCIFWTVFRKILKFHKKSVQWEASFSMRTDGRTDGQT